MTIRTFTVQCIEHDDMTQEDPVSAAWSCPADGCQRSPTGAEVYRAATAIEGGDPVVVVIS